MQVTSKSSVQIDFARSGGCIVTMRMDFWLPTPAGWHLAGSTVMQKVTQTTESQTVNLPPAQYSVVVACFVEESINGVYEFRAVAAGITVSEKAGNIDSTSNPHDSAVFKNQFVLVVQ